MSWKSALSKLGWIPILWTVNENIFTLNVVTGSSMQPTLNPDTSLWRDIALFNRLAIRGFHDYKRGDIVALKPPSNKGPMLVKRILALPGDKVQTLPPCPDQVVTIPPGHVWVEGDDQWRSRDSNHFGPVPLGLIDAKLSWIIWPFARFGPIQPSRPISQLSSTSSAWSPQDREKWRWSRVELATPQQQGKRS